MCYSFSNEAAGMVASMATFQNRRVVNKSSPPFRGEAPQDFCLRFCLVAKTQQNSEAQPFRELGQFTH
jgi:hypothetical protein